MKNSNTERQLVGLDDTATNLSYVLDKVGLVALLAVALFCSPVMTFLGTVPRSEIVSKVGSVELTLHEDVVPSVNAREQAVVTHADVLTGIFDTSSNLQVASDEVSTTREELVSLRALGSVEAKELSSTQDFDPAEMGPNETAPVPAPVAQEGVDRTPDSLRQAGAVLYDWTSVDSYHVDPPEYNALGRFEDRWYAAHSFTDIGASVSGLQEGDLLRVDGTLLQVSWVYYGSYELGYYEARDIVGHDSYCLQTCTGVGTGVRIVVCYPA